MSWPPTKSERRPVPLDGHGRSRRLTTQTQLVWAVVDAAREAAPLGAPVQARDALRTALDDLDGYLADLQATRDTGK